MNKTYEHNIEYPLHLTFDNTQFIKTGVIPTTVDVNVEGTGWRIFLANWGVGVDPYEYNVKSAFQKNYFLGKELYRFITDHAENLRIREILNDTIHFNIEQSSTKMIEMKVNPTFIDPAFALRYDINIQPKEVKAYGPKSFIDMLPNHYTITIPELNKGISLNKRAVPLKDIFSKKIKLDRETVEVTAIVDEYIPKELYTKIALPTFEDKLVDVKIIFEAIKESDISIEQFKFIVRQETKQTGTKYYFELMASPQSVRNIELTPRNFMVIEQ